MTPQTFVIVGASLAGAKAAQALREHGFDGRVVLIGSEPERPYIRPPLSKDYLAAKVGLDKVYVHDEGFYEAHEIELRTATSVQRIDQGAAELVLAGDERLGYDRLLLSTGAAPRRLSIPGADLDGIHYLRTLPESERLRARMQQGGRLAVIGAGCRAQPLWTCTGFHSGRWSLGPLQRPGLRGHRSRTPAPATMRPLSRGARCRTRRR